MDKPYIEKVLEAKLAYEKIKNKQTKNLIDSRLLDLLDDKR